jgi:hypothetical protein
MDKRSAKAVMEIYACGAWVSAGLVCKAIDVLTPPGRRSRFVEECFMKRAAIEGTTLRPVLEEARA